MEAGQADVAVGPTPPEWEGPCRVIGVEEFVIAAAPEALPYRDGAQVPLADLAQQEWVHYTARSGLSDILNSPCCQATSSPRTSTARSCVLTRPCCARSRSTRGSAPTRSPQPLSPQSRSRPWSHRRTSPNDSDRWRNRAVPQRVRLPLPVPRLGRGRRGGLVTGQEDQPVIVIGVQDVDADACVSDGTGNRAELAWGFLV